MITKLFSKKKNSNSDFSKFIREASSGEKKKVFMSVIKSSTNDQRKIMGKDYKTRAL